ncbi:hypothetical protein NKJ16_31255 [Mesorhizobium sp. M0179]|uniref:hypothetical protein n=1 Tax=unclassified Mesorhizobium TaxID=325217 RepID=UPI0012EB5E9C|nr:hypothetical protein [Mesorhizobium sp. LNJC384A00]
MPNTPLLEAGEGYGRCLPFRRFSRALLGAIASIPAIRGAAAAHVSPQPAPLPSEEELLQAYSEWLFFERLLLMRDIYPRERNPYRQTALVPCNTLAAHYHFPLR